MPRQRGGAAPARRPMAPAAPARPAPQQQQQRPSSTAAYPPRQQGAPQQAAPQQSSGGSGLFGQMASTAAGVAVGSSIGHAIGGFFGGGSSAAPATEQDNFAAEHQYNATGAQQQQQAQGPCGMDVQNFRQCMDQNQGNLTVCGWYLDQLKACQQAASQY